MKIGILAVQGAFAEHKTKLEKLGARCVELRKKEDLDGGFDGLVLPGGESTVQGKLLRDTITSSGARLSRQTAAATISTMESTAPTS